jgi:hypothetical protein
MRSLPRSRSRRARDREELAQLRDQVDRLAERADYLDDQVGESRERLDLADALIMRRLGMPLRPASRAVTPPPRALVDAATRATSGGGEVDLQVGDTRLVLLLEPGGGDPERIWDWVQDVAPSFRMAPDVAS